MKESSVIEGIIGILSAIERIVGILISSIRSRSLVRVFESRLSERVSMVLMFGDSKIV
jgi:hypothetical protein